MKKRFISAMIMLPLLILLIVRGVPLYVGGAILMLIALHEFYSAFENIDYHPIKILGYAYAIFVFFANLYGFITEAYSFGLFLVFIISILFVLAQKSDVIDICLTFCGIFYICMCFNYIIMTVNNINNGKIFVWLIFIISFATDIFAYLVGKRFGKNKLIPNVSPNKTVEGSLGGIAASVIFSVIFGIAFKLPIMVMILVSLVGSIVAQMGDLIASSIKRYVGIKDFGKIIPGHGGVLDRFDSVLLVSPYVYLVLVYFIK